MERAKTFLRRLKNGSKSFGQAIRRKSQSERQLIPTRYTILLRTARGATSPRQRPRMTEVMKFPYLSSSSSKTYPSVGDTEISTNIDFSFATASHSVPAGNSRRAPRSGVNNGEQSQAWLEMAPE